MTNEVIVEKTIAEIDIPESEGIIDLSKIITNVQLIDDDIIEVNVTEQVTQVIIEENINQVIISEDKITVVTVADVIEQTVGSGNEISNVNCTAAEAVLDCVYISSNNTAKQGNASNISTAKVIGFIKSKESPTSCTILFSGVLEGFSGLIAGKVYFLDIINGKIKASPPVNSGEVLIQVGTALTDEKLLIDIDKNLTIRS